jgi:hypothetical protein
MTDNAKTARLWLGFHHLSEKQKNLSITITEQIAKSLQGAQYAEAKTGERDKPAVCRNR